MEEPSTVDDGRERGRPPDHFNFFTNHIYIVHSPTTYYDHTLHYMSNLDAWCRKEAERILAQEREKEMDEQMQEKQKRTHEQASASSSATTPEE